MERITWKMNDIIGKEPFKKEFLHVWLPDCLITVVDWKLIG